MTTSELDGGFGREKVKGFFYKTVSPTSNYGRREYKLEFLSIFLHDLQGKGMRVGGFSWSLLERDGWKKRTS
jgi:hypothetical protein